MYLTRAGRDIVFVILLIHGGDLAMSNDSPSPSFNPLPSPSFNPLPTHFVTRAITDRFIHVEGLSGDGRYGLGSMSVPHTRGRRRRSDRLEGGREGGRVKNRSGLHYDSHLKAISTTEVQLYLTLDLYSMTWNSRVLIRWRLLDTSFFFAPTSNSRSSICEGVRV